MSDVMGTWLLVALAVAFVLVLVNLPEGKKPEDDDIDRGPDNDRGMW